MASRSMSTTSTPVPAGTASVATPSPSEPANRKTTTLLTACNTIAASRPPVSQTTAEAASPKANRSRNVHASGGRWAAENSAAVSTAATTAPARGRPTHPAIAWLRYPRNTYSSAADCNGVVSSTTSSSHPNPSTGPVASQSPATKPSRTLSSSPAASVGSASSVYGASSRHRSRASTDDDQPIPIPCAAAHDSHTQGMATISETLTSSSRAGSVRSVGSIAVGSGNAPAAKPPTNTSPVATRDRKSTRLNSSHANISYAVFCLKKKK